MLLYRESVYTRSDRSQTRIDRCQFPFERLTLFIIVFISARHYISPNSLTKIAFDLNQSQVDLTHYSVNGLSLSCLNSLR